MLLGFTFYDMLSDASTLMIVLVAILVLPIVIGLLVLLAWMVLKPTKKLSYGFLEEESIGTEEADLDVAEDLKEMTEWTSENDGDVISNGSGSGSDDMSEVKLT